MVRQTDTPLVAPAPDATDLSPPSTGLPVEPFVGLQDFVALQQVRAPAVAALARWMALQGHSRSGHYPLAQWQQWYAQMLAT
jgi:hypothetical protein